MLHLTGGRTVAARPKGQNRELIEGRWDHIDWSQYDMWGFLNESHIANVVNYKIWKRTSKAGLEFQTTVRQRTVHFLLDTFLQGDGLQSAINKGGAHGKSITAGELRWLYRNWRNPLVRAHVRFWIVDDETQPPWEMAMYRDLWATYQPKGLMNRDSSRPLAAALGVHGEPSDVGL